MFNPLMHALTRIARQPSTRGAAAITAAIGLAVTAFCVGLAIRARQNQIPLLFGYGFELAELAATITATCVWIIVRGQRRRRRAMLPAERARRRASRATDLLHFDVCPRCGYPDETGAPACPHCGAGRADA